MPEDFPSPDAARLRRRDHRDQIVLLAILAAGSVMVAIAHAQGNPGPVLYWLIPGMLLALFSTASTVGRFLAGRPGTSPAVACLSLLTLVVLVVSLFIA